MEAKEEVMVLSLDGGKKKKKPGHLRPLPVIPNGQKITGNYAAEILAELEKSDLNKQRTNAMRQLDREINGYLKLNTNDLT